MAKTVKIVALLLVALAFLCSCAHNSDFNGGVLLDSDKMSEIRAEVFATTSSGSEVVSESNEVTTEQTSEAVLEQTEESCESTECESEYNTSSEESASNVEEDGIVCWTKNGKVWHSSRDCRYIINSEVESGAVEDAIEAGKDRACSSCGG